ncbi:MAG: D-arabinono-1,4-lactone oxidase [Acidobacteriota bacterium]
MNRSNEREEWTNCIGNQKASPVQIFRPTTLGEIVDIIQRAERENRRVRAVGSGHSFSDVALTDDFLIDTHGLNRVLPLETETLKQNKDRSMLVETECGIRISELNSKLDQKGLALQNAGGHTAQTIVGALSTSTHGSGIEIGSLASFVKSIVIVAGEGKAYRVEPTNGITDPQEFNKRHSDVELRQDDDWFNAVVVSLGCMGVVYSVTLEVMQKYWLKETRTVSRWTQVKAELLKGDVLKQFRHYEVLVNPYKFDGDHSCLITAREVDSKPARPSPDQANRSPLSVLFSWLPRPLIRFSGRLEIFKLSLLPGAAPRTIENSIEALKDKVYIAESYRVLDLGAPNYVAAYSSELALPVENGAYIDAVDKIIEIAERNRVKKTFHSLPISLRFVAQSNLYFSMMYGRTTCMLEVPMIDGTKGGMETLREIEDALVEFEARPHWGQIHYLAGGREAIKKMYPMFDRWVAVRKALNSKGTFNNRFSERCGFDA